MKQKFYIDLPGEDYATATRVRHAVAEALDSPGNAYERISDPRIYETGVYRSDLTHNFLVGKFVIEVTAINNQPEGDMFDIKRRLRQVAVQHGAVYAEVRYGK